MAKIVDESIGYLPENIQRELNDAWASGMSSPYTRAVDPLNAVLLNRAQTIRGMQMEIAALKAQRDELLAGLQLAYIAMQHMGNVLNNIDAVDEEEDAQHDAAFEAVAALIAKHKEASHG